MDKLQYFVFPNVLQVLTPASEMSYFIVWKESLNSDGK
jgi:hypothetical protein